MTIVQQKKVDLAEDTMIKAIAPAMKKRHEERRKRDHKARINRALAKSGIPLRVVR